MTATIPRPLFLLLASLIVVGGTVVASLAQEATPQAGEMTIFPPKVPVSGVTLAEWSARHWQWTTSFPVGLNPGQDSTGTTCSFGQSGPVFFLPRNYPPCVVPAGVALFVPIAGSVCSTAEPPPFAGRDEGELRACAEAEAERYTGITVRVDGQAVPDIQACRASSPLFALALPKHNVLGAPAGPAFAVADGYQIILPPLPAGDHAISVHIELTDGTVLPDKVARISVVAPPGGITSAPPDLGTPLATPLA